MGRVKGKIALVTGAAQGLGEASARLLAKEGAQVAISDINFEGAHQVASSIGDSAMAIEHDVTDEEAWQVVLEQVVEHFGGLNVLVNNAGIMELGTVEEISFADWKRTHSIDLDSVFLGCKYAIEPIKNSGGGSIINISSISSHIAGHNMAAYNSAKAGVRLLTKSVALQCAKQKYNIRCNSIHPVFISTPMLKEAGARLGIDDPVEKFGRQVPLGHVGKPIDVAYAVLYLASDESRLMTGSELIIDGGVSAM